MSLKLSILGQVNFGFAWVSSTWKMLESTNY